MDAKSSHLRGLCLADRQASQALRGQRITVKVHFGFAPLAVSTSNALSPPRTLFSPIRCCLDVAVYQPCLTLRTNLFLAPHPVSDVITQNYAVTDQVCFMEVIPPFITCSRLYRLFLREHVL